jgi:O-methyltransferase
MSPLGEAFRPGELRATREQLVSNFRRAHLSLPVVHKKWFADLTPDDIPESIAVAFLDGDYYESIMSPLKLIEDQMTGGALIVVDDYGNDKLPGAKRAVDDWLRTRPQWQLLQSVASLAIIGTRGVS